LTSVPSLEKVSVAENLETSALCGAAWAVLSDMADSGISDRKVRYTKTDCNGY
jgi:hypothetical protein